MSQLPIDQDFAMNLVRTFFLFCVFITRELGCSPVPSLHTHVLLCQLQFVVSLEKLRDLLKVLIDKR